MSWTHSTPVREAEGRAAAKVLGVPEDRLTFWDFPDGDVVDHLTPLCEKMKSLVEKVRPDRICCGAFEQGHLDHDSTIYAVCQNFDGPIFEIPFYHVYLSKVQKLNRFATPGPEEVLMLSDKEQRFKKDFAKLYPSTNIWSCLFWYEVYQAIRFQPVELAKTERMRLKVHCDFKQPNHVGRLLTRVQNSDRWKRWLAAHERKELGAEFEVSQQEETPLSLS